MSVKNFLYLVLIILFSCTYVENSLLLSGSPSSFALYPPWAPSFSPLTIEFSTTNPNGLLLYAHSSNSLTAFIEIKLVHSGLRLRYTSTRGPSVLTIGSHLNNGLWHRVQLFSTHSSTKLVVDGFSGLGSPLPSWDDVGFDKIYVGGLPLGWENKLSDLSLPTVLFEPKFSGGVRNVGYGGRSVNVIEWKGLLSNPAHTTCNHYDPCLNGGYCISTNSGPLCDCSLIDYDGIICEKETPPPSAYFNSKSSISMHLPQGLFSSQDEIELLFKTTEPNGGLFYVGDGDDYMSIHLIAGHLSVSINLGSGPHDTVISPPTPNLNDNKWHSLVVRRKVQEVTTILDSSHYDSWTLSGQFTLLQSNFISMASWNSSERDVELYRNFKGCLKKVTYKADTLILNLIDLAKKGNQLVQVNGNVHYDCNEAAHKELSHSSSSSSKPLSTLTLTHPSSSLLLPSSSSSLTSLSFSFRTNEPSGTLLSSPAFSLELLGGALYLLLGSLRLPVSPDGFLANSGWWSVSLWKERRRGGVRVGNVSTEFNWDGELGRELVVGGMGRGRGWSKDMGYSYVGCFGEVRMNGEGVNLHSLIQHQDEATLHPQCVPGSSGFCLSNPCKNGAKCTDGWNRFICDCSHTDYTGLICHLPTATLPLDGFRNIKLDWVEKYEAEEIKVRFRTFKIHGLLLLLNSESGSDFLQLSIDFTRIKLSLSIHSKEMELFSGSNLNDNQWHLVKYTRHGNVVRVQIDNEPSVNGELSSRNITSSYTSLTLGYSPSHPPFIGHISQLIISNFDLLNNLNFFTPTPTPAPSPQSEIIHPVSISSPLKLPQLNIYSSISLSFKMRTNNSEGLVLYNGGKDYLVIEIVRGKVECKFRDSGRTYSYTSGVGVSDGKWHEVRVRKGRGVSGLEVDGEVQREKIEGNGGVMKLRGVLYLGGLPSDLMYSIPTLSSSTGFSGCLANTQLGDIIDLMTENLGTDGGISPGCIESTCSSDSCFGSCLHNECNCEMTGMRGKFCNESLDTFTFNSTLLLYTLASPRSGKEDRISFRLKPNSLNGVLITLNSHMSNDFIIIKLSGGLLSLSSSILESKTSLTYPSRLESNEWHLVKIIRMGGNWTIQINDGLEIWKNPGSSSPTIFRDLKTIGVGGRLNHERRRIYDPYSGSMSGLRINSVQPFELYASSNPQVELIGNSFISQNFDELMMKAPASSYQPIEKGDELISSASPPCPIDDDIDEEECISRHNIGSSGGDELITPLYSPSTPTFTPHFPPSAPCDDEDCGIGGYSGDGAIGPHWGIKGEIPGYVTTTTTESGGERVVTFETSGGRSFYTVGEEKSTTIGSTRGTTTGSTSTSTDGTTHQSSTPILTSSLDPIEKEPPTVRTTTSTTTSTTSFRPPTTRPYKIVQNQRIFDFVVPNGTVGPPPLRPPKGTETRLTIVGGGGDSTLVVIIIIALLLIIIVSILIIFFMCKRRDEAIFKVEGGGGGKIDYGGSGGGGGRVKGAGGVKEWYV